MGDLDQSLQVFKAERIPARERAVFAHDKDIMELCDHFIAEAFFIKHLFERT